MGMGTAFFTLRTEINLSLEDRAYFAPLRNFLDDWDEIYNYTGEPMRFTAHGFKKTDW